MVVAMLQIRRNLLRRSIWMYPSLVGRRDRNLKALRTTKSASGSSTAVPSPLVGPPTSSSATTNGLTEGVGGGQDWDLRLVIFSVKVGALLYVF